MTVAEEAGNSTGAFRLAAFRRKASKASSLASSCSRRFVLQVELKRMRCTEFT